VSERLDLLRPALDRFKRPFTVFDFGAGIHACVGLEIATAYENAIVVLAEKDARNVYAPRTMHLRKELTCEDLEGLSRSEDFDVALALNILHWLKDNWVRALGALFDYGSLFVQIPGPDDLKTCNVEYAQEIYYWCSKTSRCLGDTAQFEGHLKRPLYEISKQEPGSQYSVMLNAKSAKAKPHEVRCVVTTGHDHKDIALLHKRGPVWNTQPFVHGLTLQNFCELGGVYPTRDTVLKLLRDMPVPNPPHRDIQPWNIRFNGTAMHLIDPGEPDWVNSDAANMRHVVEWVDAEMRRWEK
jgi:hypothetical protein